MTFDFESTLDSVRPESLQYYLSRSGWTEQSFKRADQIKFGWHEDGDITVVVPRNTRSVDYSFALGRVLKTLSQIEHRPIGEILRNIVNPNVDVIKFRFMGYGIDGASLPLSYAMAAVANIRDALIFSACAELNQKPFFPRQLRNAVELVDKSRFGQTEHGSFVITVEMPLESQIAITQARQAAIPIVGPPMQRRVISRILRGADKARRVALSNELVDAENDFKTGLNANLAEALAALKIADQELSVELSALWDRSLPAPSDVPSTPVTLESRSFESLVSIGHLFRGSIASRSVTVTGRIVSLSRDDSEEDDFEADHSITIKIDGDTVTKTAKVMLSPDDYALACDWHKEKKKISIGGILERPGKSWIITGYQHFSAVT